MPEFYGKKGQTRRAALRTDSSNLNLSDMKLICPATEATGFSPVDSS